MRCLALGVLAVLALAGCTSVDTLEKRAERSTPPPVLESQGALRTPESEPWRTEVWHEVQLRVPASWTVGYAPMPERGGALLCGIGPLETAPDGPYVGRPGYGSDLCEYRELDDLRIGGEGVWFGSPLPEGGTSWDALDQRTVSVGTTKITVATEDAQVLRRILGSVELLGTDVDANGCPAAPEPERGHLDEGYGAPRSLSVCLYDRRRAAGWDRTWSARLAASAAGRLTDTVEAAQPATCDAERPPDQLLLLRATTDDPFGDHPVPRDFLVDVGGGCPTLTPAASSALSAARPASLALTDDLVRPWASDGVRTYVVGMGLPRSLQRFFRPVWG